MGLLKNPLFLVIIGSLTVGGVSAFIMYLMWKRAILSVPTGAEKRVTNIVYDPTKEEVVITYEDGEEKRQK